MCNGFPEVEFSEFLSDHTVCSDIVENLCKIILIYIIRFYHELHLEHALQVYK